MSNLRSCAFILLILFSVTPSFATNKTFEKGVAKDSVTLRGLGLVSASVEAIETPNGYVYSKAYMWGGDDTSPPERIIKIIKILRNGRIFFIPLSAYSDLGNPRKISLEKISSHGFRLIIDGGDASGSYSAAFDFNKNEIFSRKVVSSEFPKEVWEKTIFSFNHLNN